MDGIPNGNWRARNIVIDLEFTPVSTEHRVDGLKNEIIKIGAVKLDAQGEYCGEFSHLVAPQYANGVNWFVKDLTSITSYDVYNADELSVVVFQLAEWIGNLPARMITWSRTDKRQLTKECLVKRIPTNRLPKDWLDIQPLFPPLMGLDRGAVSLGDAADWFGCHDSNGHDHHALSDAKATASLLSKLINGTLAEQPGAADVRRRLGMEPIAGKRAETANQLRFLSAKLKAQEALGLG